jgi:cytochrome c oxidase assembly protein subunit 15
MVSALLIAIAAILVWRALPKPYQVISPLNRALSGYTAVIGLIAIVIGVIVTGAGPHAGDIDTPRNGFDLEVWQHYHSWPAYALLLLLLVQFASQFKATRSIWKDLPTRILLLTVLVTIGQAIVGVAQARMGVPPLLVGIHMLGAASLCALITFQFLAARRINR